MENKIKILIIFFIVFIVVLTIIILLLNKNSNNNVIYEGNTIINTESFELKVEDELTKITSENEYFNIKNSIQAYVDYFNNKNYNAILKVLDENYIKNNNITLDNLKEKYKDVDGLNYIIKTLYKKQYNIDTTIYYVEGKMANKNYTKITDSGFTLIVDTGNGIYSIIPENLKNTEYKYNYSIKKDSENYYNKFIYGSYSKQDVLQEYFKLYKNLAVNNVKEAFLLLDEEYRNKRFNGSQEEFIKYLNEIDIKNIYLDKINYYINDNYNEYVGIDKNGLYYIFKETSIMNFKVTLDTYTLPQTKFSEEYLASNNQKKVMMNIDKFFQMINSKDYKAAYNYLSQSFKNNYFKTQESFEKYIKNNLYKYNSVAYRTYNDKLSGVYGYELVLTDKQNITKSKTFNIVMKLNSGTDFEISFEI